MNTQENDKSAAIEALKREINQRRKRKRTPSLNHPISLEIDQGILSAWRTANNSPRHLKHALHHEAFREASEAILILDERLRVIDANYAAFEWTGLDEALLIGAPWEQLFEGQAPAIEPLGPSQQSSLNVLLKKTDAQAPLNVDVSTSRFTHNKSTRYVSIIHDVTIHDRVECALRLVAAGTAHATGESFFKECVKNLAQATGVKWAMATEFTDDSRDQARTFAVWEGDGFAKDFSYETSNTPCELVLDGHVCHFENYMKDLFPLEKELVEFDINSYRGTPLFNSKGEVLGHLAIYDHQPLEETPELVSIMQIFTARASAELERMYADRALERQRKDLAHQVKTRTAEIERALAEVESLKNRLAEENLFLRNEITRTHKFDEIVGSDPKLMKVLEDVSRVAATEATVLVTGESGTGKELIARAIHQHSDRSDKPIIQINCGAISPSLVESELFGHMKGAFTGATENRPGRFELAHGGTLFLDEVGELPLDIQVKLLRVLQEGTFQRVGGKDTIKVDVRIVAATNRTLENEVAKGSFREDLFYRLNTFPIHLPALRERASDIPPLAHYFLERIKKKTAKPIEGFSEQAIELLRTHTWPGNIRELKNVVERAVIISDGPLIQVRHEHLRSDHPECDSNVITKSPRTFDDIAEIERNLITDTLEATHWKIEGANGAAKRLACAPSTLRDRMKRYGIRKS
ncbi:sigma 54-interacting transcriptional regulator [Pelagicoccus sp. SDUM812003]|uniref:sigma 54-interacting transcriptional regulator n=1 Tax=Pelagicoccus sp. SDUM812003 TaxID=3041267 RepID=UPI00280DD87E|nr:sigma 54-interacting transcriptional regulator [Pelagicoccus sp. SDUM812003]MDQ8202212.1 sigma 54-interacting transcriptional regulator [Pelagicoccus sp. SDUM812003]